MWFLARAILVPFKLAFGYDVFISYARRDGSSYAEALVNALSGSVAPRIDLQETRAGETLPLVLLVAVALSRVLVVVSTPRASESVHVGQEVLSFVHWSNGPIVAIQLTHPIESARWGRQVRGVPVIEEDPAGPSGAVVQRIVQSVGFWRRSRRLLLAGTAAALGLAILGMLIIRADHFTGQARGATLGTIAQSMLAQPVTSSTAPLIAAYAVKGWRLSGTSDAWNAMQRVPFARRIRIFGPDPFDNSSPMFPGSSAERAVTLDPDGTVSIWATKHDGERIRLKHDVPILLVALSPDGKSMATVGKDQTVRLWAVPDGRELKRFRSARAIRLLVFSSHGKWLASSGEDGTIDLWDPWERGLRHTLPRRGGAKQIAIDQTGELVAVAGSGGDVRIVAFAGGEELARVSVAGEPAGLAFSPDSHQLTIAEQNGTARIVAVHGGKEIAAIPYRGQAANAVALSADGRFIAIGPHLEREYAPFEVRIVSLTDGRDIRLPYDTGFDGVVFTADGRGVAVSTHEQSGGGSIASVDLWEFDLDGREDARFVGNDGLADIALDSMGKFLTMAFANGASQSLTVPDGKSAGAVNHGGPLTKVTVSPDGSASATAGEDGVVRVWSVKDSRESATGRQPSSIANLAFSSNGRRVVSVSANGHLQTLEVAPGSTPAQGRIPDCCDLAAFSPNGQWLVFVREGDASVIQVPETKVSRKFTWPSYEPDFNEPSAVAIAPDGKLVAVGQQHGATLVLNISGIGSKRNDVERAPNAPEITRVAVQAATVVRFSPGGGLLAAASMDGTVRLVAIPSGREIGRISQGTGVKGLALSNSGWLATSDDRGHVRLWNTSLDRMVKRLCLSRGLNLSPEEWIHAASLNGLAWSPTCENWPTPGR